MAEQNRDTAQDIFNAMMAAARGEDKIAGDFLRGAFGKISGQVLPGGAAAGGRGPGAAFAGPGKVDQGEKDQEVLGEE